MAYAKKWPIAKDMEGLVIVKNNRMDVEITSGKISETEISEGKARIENVGMKKERLWISGKSNGQVENFLDFVLDSPISRNEKETLSKIQGDGAGNLSMELTMPLFKKEKPEVIGYFQGSGTLFKMADLIPPVSNYNVKFEFNENTIRSGSGNALFLGKPLIYSASLLKDGGLGIGTLKLWAQMDNPSEYIKFKDKSIYNQTYNTMVKDDVQTYEIAELLYSYFGDSFICVKSLVWVPLPYIFMSLSCLASSINLGMTILLSCRFPYTLNNLTEAQLILFSLVKFFK